LSIFVVSLQREKVSYIDIFREIFLNFYTLIIVIITIKGVKMEDDSLLVNFLGDYPVVRVLDFLVENNIFDYSKKDICRFANVSWNTLEIFWGNLVESGIVEYTRKVGKARMFKLDTSNPVAQKMLELDKTLMKQSIESLDKTDKKLKAIA